MNDENKQMTEQEWKELGEFVEQLKAEANEREAAKFLKAAGIE